MGYEDAITLKDGRIVDVKSFEPSDTDNLVVFYSTLSPEVLKWALPPYDRERIERWTSNPRDSIILLACHADKIVGHLQIFHSPGQRLKGIGQLIIYLHQDFLNRGLGTAMTKRGLELARTRGFHRVGLSVVAENVNAIHVYEKVGFKREGIRKDAYLGEDDRYYDMIEMGVVFD